MVQTKEEKQIDNMNKRKKSMQWNAQQKKISITLKEE